MIETVLQVQKVVAYVQLTVGPGPSQRRAPATEAHIQGRGVRTVGPGQADPVVLASHGAGPGERRVGIAVADEPDERGYHGTGKVPVDLGACVVVAVDVPADPGPGEQVHVVSPCEQADVVDLAGSRG